MEEVEKEYKNYVITSVIKLYSQLDTSFYGTRKYNDGMVSWVEVLITSYSLSYLLPMLLP